MHKSPSVCLALDTALDSCSVGLAIEQDGEIKTYDRSFALGRGHAEYLMGELQALFDETGLAYRDLTRLATTIGPGSFTGLRIGLATARALALALDIPLVGLSSLKALELTARKIGEAGAVACAIDARRGQIYGQLFTSAQDSQPAAISAAEFAALCSVHGEVTMIGSGADLVKQADPALEGMKDLAISAPDMASLALWALSADPSHYPPDPLYLRAPDAKPQASKAIARR